MTDDAPLTEKQRHTLETALELGYFETPRELTLKDLADELDISHQALSERLRRATASLTRAALAPSGESDTMWVGSSHTVAESYHQSPDCPNLSQSNSKPVDERTAEWHDLEPCSRCAGTLSLGPTDAVPGGAD